MPSSTSTSKELRFDGLTAVITGAGGGLGRVYALYLAARGASVLINDVNPANAKAVVDEVVAAGGRAAANSDSVVSSGPSIIDAAVRAFNGRIDILINNAGILRDKSFARMSPADWDSVIAVHLRGAYSVTKAAWPLMVRQRFGRIINTASAAGIYGNVGQANYSAAKLALHGLTLSLAREGARANITCNSIAPLAASQMTATVMPPEILEALKPELVAPFVAYLVHESCLETGAIFEVGAGYAAKLRRQRAAGASFSAKTLISASALAELKSAWPKITSFSASETTTYPTSALDTDWMGLLEKSLALKEGKMSSATDPTPAFSGKVAIVTGAGAGIGRAYALLFGRLGANVVVNDVSRGAAESVAREITRVGPGSAVANSDSVELGERIIEQALKAYGGRIDVLVNNAGILRDKSFCKMTDADWDDVIRVHLNGTFKVTHAAWPHMIKNKYGRIINTSSAIGLYGNFGQANYAAAKAAIIAFTYTLAHEGKRNNILVNAIAPNAGTSMTATVMPKEMVEALKPDYVAPFVAFLAHESNNTTGGVFECGSGWIAPVRWERAGGHMFSRNPAKMTPEAVRDSFSKVCDFEKSRVTYPTSAAESFQSIYSLVTSSPNEKSGDEKIDNSSDTRTVDVKKARAAKFSAVSFDYTQRDVILYALGVGATRDNLQWVYENSADFHALPSFGVIYMLAAMSSVSLADHIGDFNPMQLVHGEQYVELHVPQLPVTGKVISEPKIVDIQDKGKGALVVLGINSFDSDTKKLLAYSESSLFIRGSGNFKKIGADAQRSKRRAPPAGTSVPQSPPDARKACKTSQSQAALYRLSGDLNPLHIDSEMSKMGGFKVPILHGLCTLGFGVRHVYSSFKPIGQTGFPSIANIQCRMSAHVFPGETLVTEMWQTSPTRVTFQVRVLERNNKVVISNAAIDFAEPVQVAKTESGKNFGARETGGSEVSATFNALSSSLSRLHAATRLDLTRRMPSVYEFYINDSNGKQHVWTLDLKSVLGAVIEGPLPTNVSNSNDSVVVKFTTDLATLRKSLQGDTEALATLTSRAAGNRHLVTAFPRILGMLGKASRL